MIVALQLGVKVMRAEDGGEMLVGMAGDANEAAGELCDFVEGGGAFAFGSAELHAGDEAAQVLIPLSGLDDQRVGAPVRAGDLGADDGAQSDLPGGEMEAGRAVDAVAVEDRHG